MQASLFLPGDSVPVCSHTLVGKQSLKEMILQNELLHDTDHSMWNNWMSQHHSSDAIDVKGPVFEDFNLLRAATLAGQGIALCPHAMISDDLRAGHLVKLSDKPINTGFSYYLIQRQHSDRAENVIMDGFVLWLSEQLAASS